MGTPLEIDGGDSELQGIGLKGRSTKHLKTIFFFFNPSIILLPKYAYLKTMHQQGTMKKIII